MADRRKDRIRTLTNKIEVSFDYDAIVSQYDMYEIKIPHSRSEDKAEYRTFYERARRQFPSKARAVWSKRAGEGKLLILVNKGESLEKSGFDIKKVGFAQMREVPVRVMFSMLLSIMAGRTSFFELTDNPFEIYYPFSMGQKKMIALRVQLKEGEEGIFMSLGATNFIVASEPSQKYPSYVYDHGVLRRYAEEADGGGKRGEGAIYIKKGMGKRRVSVTFFYLNHRFKESKVYFFHRVVEDAKAHLSDLMDFSFVWEEVKVVSEGKGKSKQNKRLEEVVRHYARDVGRINIAILDRRCEGAAKLFTQEVEDFLKEESLGLFDGKVDISISDKIDRSCPNISLTLPASYYQENELPDPYEGIDRSVPVQNYTVEVDECDGEGAEAGKTLLHVLLKELAIKCELHGYEPFFDHGKYSLDGLTFISIEKYLVQEASAIYGKAFLSKGRMVTGELSEEEKDRVDFALTELPVGEYPEFVVWDERGNIVLGTRTAMFPIPDFSTLAESYEESTKPHYFTKEEVVACADGVGQYRLKKHIDIELPAYADGLSPRERFLAYLEEIDTQKGVEAGKLFSALDKQQKLKTALEGLAGRPLRFLPRGGDLKETYAGMLGITYIEKELGVLYHVGLGKENIPDKIERNSPYRRIIPISGEISPLELFPLMEVYFVKNKELTVLPCPIKYAREGAALATNDGRTQIANE